MEANTSMDGDSAWRAQAAALRRLALGLVRDGHEADELLQEVWLRAQGEAPRTRGWFVTTLRNLVADRARSRARRAAHERTVAKSEAVPSSAEVLERLELAEKLARELALLPEPHRLVLHLRYFEELAPDEIAARLGLPRETVRTRLKRGLAELRARLDRAHGGERRAWALALVPLARGSGHTGAGTPLALAGSVGGIVMGTKLAVGAALVAAALLFWWWRGDGEVAAPPAVVAAPPAEIAAPAAVAVVAEPAATREVAPLAAVPSAPAAAPASDTRKVAVRVVLADEQGLEHTDESGTLKVGVIESEGKFDILDLAFEHGGLTLDVLAGRQLVFGRMAVRGREAVLPEPIPIAPGDEPLVLRGRWLPRGSLRVVDAVTKQELADIEVRCAEGWRANPSWTHPGDHRSLETLVTQGTSPIALPDRAWGTPYWVHAPEHAWTRIDFDHAIGGERTVELARERGVVEITCLGTPPKDTYVRLYPLAPPGSRLRPQNLDFPSFAGAVSLSLASNVPTRIEDFQPGRYLAALETGEYEDRLRLGTLEFEFAAGETARIAIPLDPSALDTPKTHLVGTLRVPAELLQGRQQMRLERLEKQQPDVFLWLGDMDESEDDETLLTWDAGEVRTGTWIANLPHQYRIKFEADVAGGETSVALAMPELGLVTVEVVDAASGTPVVPKRLNWSLAPLEGVSHSTSRGMARAADGTWQFQAPLGRVQVTAHQPGYLEASESLALAGPTAQMRLELRRATGVRILLRDGEAAVPVDFSYWYQIEIRDSAGQRTLDGRSIGGEFGSRILPGPGTYTLSFPPLDGYRPLANQTVDVGPDEVVDVVVQLERD